MTNFHKRSLPLYSLVEAIIAISSIRHLLLALKSCRTYIDKVIPNSQSSYTDLFFNTQEILISELEDFIIIPQISKLIKIDWLSNSISSLKWEEKKEENNQYINRLLHLIEDFKEKLVSAGGGSIPLATQSTILTKTAKFCQEQLIDAFGKIKRCNLVGREQMRKDFKVFSSALKRIIDSKDGKIFAEYLEVWNHSSDQVYEWITHHTDFSLRIQKNLFLTAPLVASLNKNTRNNMLMAIEKIYREKLYS